MAAKIVRTFALMLCALCLLPSLAFAQAWPSRPIRIIVPFPPGGGVDFVGRVIGQKLSERLGQSVTIDNRAGANGIVGLQALIASPADGYTLAATANGSLTINPHLYSKLPYDSQRDFTYIANLAVTPLLLVAHPSLPVKNVQQLIAYARSKPGEVTYSSPGSGNAGHLAGELFNMMAKTAILHIPYKGTAPAVTGLLAGDAHLTYSGIPTILQHVRSGRVNVLGVGGLQRVPSLPDIPTIAESGLPGYEAFGWVGLIGPANIPKDIVQRLNKEVVEILNAKEVVDRLLAEGTVPTPSTPDQLVDYTKAEYKKWGEVVQKANIKAE